MGVTGDFGALERMLAGLRRLPTIAPKVAAEAAPAISGLSAAAFDAGTDPYGKAWGKTKAGGRRVLKRSGALAAAIAKYVASGRKLRVSWPKYGRYQRPPDWLPRRNLPGAWTKAIDDATAKAVNLEIGGGR